MQRRRLGTGADAVDAAAGVNRARGMVDGSWGLRRRGVSRVNGSSGPGVSGESAVPPGLVVREVSDESIVVGWRLGGGRSWRFGVIRAVEVVD